MREYFTPGIVLDREPRNELDEAITVYTKNLGKVQAFAKSSRKITSKLSGHLTPGRLANIRFVERNKLQLVDALSLPPSVAVATFGLASPKAMSAARGHSPPKKVAKEILPQLKDLLPFLHFIDNITPYGDADLGLWYMIEEIVEGGRFSPAIYRHLLERLGFFGEGAHCHYCETNAPNFFNLPEMTIFCASCSVKLDLKSDELIFLGKS